MNLNQMEALAAALKEISSNYLIAHPKPSKHRFFLTCHALFYTHHNQDIAYAFSQLSNITCSNKSDSEIEIQLLNKINVLFKSIKKSAHLLPEIHQCLCIHLPKLAQETDKKKTELDNANPPGGEYTNWGLQVADYQELVHNSVVNELKRKSTPSSEVVITTGLQVLIVALKKMGFNYLKAHPKPDQHGFFSSCRSLFSNHHNQGLAEGLTQLSADMTEQALLKQINTLYARSNKSAHLVPEIHQYLCTHLPKLTEKTNTVKTRLDYATDGECTHWGLGLSQYQEVMQDMIKENNLSARTYVIYTARH